ncbi:hypothetical protein FSJ94_023300 [Escherichia coli]|nr:hypothetical protein [Escherichia coli]
MAWYIDSKNVKKNTNEKANTKYEKIWKPGEKPDCAGIYRCQALRDPLIISPKRNHV